MTSEEIERQLEAQIEPWLAHMRWRSDFAEWRHKRIWQENYQALHIQELSRHAAPLRGVRVLDLGSGMGGFAVALARDCGSKVVAGDLNPAYNEIARLRAQRYAIDLPALTTAGEALPFPAASFDIVTAWDVLEHVQEPARFLSECARVLKARGRLFLTAINRLALRDPHYHLLFVNWMPRPAAERIVARLGRSKRGSPLHDRQALSEMHYFTYGALTRLAARYGFKVRDLRGERVQRAANSQRANARIFVLRGLARIGTLNRAYRFYRALAMGTFELMLSKVQDGDD